MFDIKEVLAEAEQEVRDEMVEKAKVRIKEKMRIVKEAEIVLANAKRELADEMLAIGDGN